MSVKKSVIKKNVGSIDRTIRIILAVILFYFMDGLDRTTQLVMGILAVILIFTALNGFCLLYLPFKFSTIKKAKTNE